MSQYHIGFSGTQHGLAHVQAYNLGVFCQGWEDSRENDEFVFHHGECIGADEEFHLIAEKLGWTPETYPPIKTNKQSKIASSHKGFRHPPKDYLARDEDIVNDSDFMIFCPNGFVPVRRSGTWYTARYAFKTGVFGTVIYPDGSSDGLGNIFN